MIALAKPCQDYVWTMRDKTKIRVGDMTHTHLKNTIGHVKRAIGRHEAEIDAASSYNGGDEAMRCAEISANEAHRKANQGRGWLTVLTAEQDRRSNLSTAEEALEIMQEGIDA